MGGVVNINEVLDGHVSLGIDCIDRLCLNAYVRHEALSNRVGCKTPPLGCPSSPVKLRAAWARSCGRGRQAALTTT